MARNEKTSQRVARIAARGLKVPSSLNAAEVKAVCASVLTQAPDRKRIRPRGKKAIYRVDWKRA
jgi:hypothetical protein